MQLTGLHHITLICRDLNRTTAFYRDLLGLALVHQATNDDDPDARHFFFGDPSGSPGSLISFLEYPSLPPMCSSTARGRPTPWRSATSCSASGAGD